MSDVAAPLRVLEIVVRYFPATGGVETTVHELTRRLAQRGHAMRVLCAANPSGPAEVDGVPVTRLPYRWSLGGTHLAPGVAAAAERARPQLIHAHLPTAWWVDGAARAARRLRVPLVISYNNDLCGPGIKGTAAAVYNHLVLPRRLRQAAAVVVPNSRYGELSPHLRRWRGAPAVIPWGVDTDRFRPAGPAPLARDSRERQDDPGRPLTLGFLSVLDRHHDYKGLAGLLRAAAGAIRRGMPLRLRIGGEGDARARYQALARELSIEPAVAFLGFVPPADLPAFYAGCDLFCLPSTNAMQEGFGLVALEAMSSGRPVLTTEIVGVASELAARAAGFVVPPGDEPALEAAIVAAASQPQALVTMGANGRRLAVERYAWEIVTDAYESLFFRLVAGLAGRLFGDAGARSGDSSK